MQFPEWPSDPRTIGITNDEKKSLDLFLKVFIPEQFQSHQRFSPPPKKTLFDFGNKKWFLLIDTHFFYDASGNISHLIVYPNIDCIVGEGVERSVKGCYDLWCNMYCVIKPIEKREKQILKRLKGLGTPEVINFYSKNSSPDIKQRYVVEKYYSGNLLEYLNTVQIEGIEIKLFIMRDILKGLIALNSIKIPSLEVPQINHYDIKPQNILIDVDGSRFPKLALIDYGFAGRDNTLSGTYIYVPPECYELIGRSPPKQLPPEEECIFFNRQFGWSRDIWALGLTFTHILKNQVSFFEDDIPSPPFESLAESFMNLDLENMHFDQLTFEQEIEGFKQSFSSSLTLFKIASLIEKMIRFLPEKRLTAEKCLEEINQIIDFHKNELMTQIKEKK